jgi:short-subunit dehydrogenase
MARQVLITGVTGGIGGALAESFIANGDMVIGIGRRRDKLTALRDRLGESFDSLQAD